MKRDVALKITYRSVLSLVALQAGADPNKIADAPERGGKCLASTLRQRALYLTIICLDVPLSRAAQAAGVSKQAVSKALRRIEDQRDDKDFDRLLTRLESWLTGES